MRRVGRNSFTEIYFRGCNPSFIATTDGYVMVDSPQIPIDALRWREMMEEKAPIRYLINTEPHGDHIAGNAYFKGVKVVGQVKLQECFERYLNAFGSMDEKRERMKQSDPDSVWLVGHPDYLDPNKPSVTFTDALTLQVGQHTFNILHHRRQHLSQMPHLAPGMRPLGMARFPEADRGARCRDDRPRPRRALHEGLHQRAGADCRELGRAGRALRRSRPDRGRGAERTGRGDEAGSLSDRPEPVPTRSAPDRAHHQQPARAHSREETASARLRRAASDTVGQGRN
jgi:hypothetical protein